MRHDEHIIAALALINFGILASCQNTKLKGADPIRQEVTKDSKGGSGSENGVDNSVDEGNKGSRKISNSEDEGNKGGKSGSNSDDLGPNGKNGSGLGKNSADDTDNKGGSGNDRKRKNRPILATLKSSNGRGGDTPLVLDLNDLQTVETSSGSGLGTVEFDIAGRGQKRELEWISPKFGWLVLDLDQNGKVDSGRELFGSGTVLKGYGPLAVTASDGFEALAQYDLNHDGVIDEKDAIFSRLMVWQDLNHNGVTDQGELKTLKELSIVSISLRNETVTGEHGKITNSTAFIGQKSEYTTVVKGQRQQHKIFDVYFPQTSNSFADRGLIAPNKLDTGVDHD